MARRRDGVVMRPSGNEPGDKRHGSRAGTRDHGPALPRTYSSSGQSVAADRRAGGAGD